jgi:hypothetical protein
VRRDGLQTVRAPVAEEKLILKSLDPKSARALSPLSPPQQPLDRQSGPTIQGLCGFRAKAILLDAAFVQRRATFVRHKPDAAHSSLVAASHRKKLYRNGTVSLAHGGRNPIKGKPSICCANSQPR